MAQARVLTEKELSLLLLFINTKKHAARDRAIVLMTHLAGMRVGEVAAINLENILTKEGELRTEVRLSAKQTKGKHARTVVISNKLIREIKQYLLSRFEVKKLNEISDTEFDKPLFYTQKRNGFTANTLCYHLHMLYKAAGLTGASSHSGRRHFITNLSKKGVALRTMMELAGHRQAQTTMRYVDVTDDMKRAAVELL